MTERDNVWAKPKNPLANLVVGAIKGRLLGGPWCRTVESIAE